MTKHREFVIAERRKQRLPRVWCSLKHWGLFNVTWAPKVFVGHSGAGFVEPSMGLHLFVFHRDQWYWGKDDNYYDCLLTHWGLGPLGCISRVNY